MWLVEEQLSEVGSVRVEERDLVWLLATRAPIAPWPSLPSSWTDLLGTGSSRHHNVKVSLRSRSMCFSLAKFPN